ncbi:hypothetical protein [Arsenicibacter rosenii]|uniref:Uncharacterized protein n=1 Tax=Arsenicibacter rosenii TaxID=1750698 RepID=A0A1S2VDG5_9BACT|nr:hypothetical protein [Arsenicibacter rosenii]OIN56801.1 hypothetical protein BLX24_22765 [Arsenicibacter rosenii]
MEGIKIDFTYEAIVRIDATATQSGTTSARQVEVEYSHNLPLDQWHDGEGRYTEMGINALLFGFCNGVTAIIHNAGQLNGMDAAELFRKAISIMESQFVSQVKVSMLQKDERNTY